MTEPEGMNRFDSVQKLEGYESWSPDDVADYFESEGLVDYREVLIHHKIAGNIAPQLTDADLKDMGIEVVGDRCRFRHVIKTMNRRARHVQRNKVMWEGKEQLWFDQCEGCVNTCCGILPEDPSTYKLTNNHLKIRTVDPMRCGPVRLCCCNNYKTNNIDLSQVQDVDMNGIPPPFCQQILCCASGKEIIDVDIADQGSVYLTVAEGAGEAIVNLILNQVEESQLIERD